MSQAAEPNSYAATSTVVTETDEVESVEKEVRDIHEQLRSLLQRSQTLLAEWRQKAGGDRVIKMLEEMLHEVNNKSHIRQADTPIRTSTDHDTHSLLERYSDALLEIIREKLVTQTDGQ